MASCTLLFTIATTRWGPWTSVDLWLFLVEDLRRASASATLGSQVQPLTMREADTQHVLPAIPGQAAGSPGPAGFLVPRVPLSRCALAITRRGPVTKSFSPQLRVPFDS